MVEIVPGAVDVDRECVGDLAPNRCATSVLGMSSSNIAVSTANGQVESEQKPPVVI